MPEEALSVWSRGVKSDSWEARDTFNLVPYGCWVAASWVFVTFYYDWSEANIDSVVGCQFWWVVSYSLTHSLWVLICSSTLWHDRLVAVPLSKVVMSMAWCDLDRGNGDWVPWLSSTAALWLLVGVGWDWEDRPLHKKRKGHLSLVQWWVVLLCQIWTLMCGNHNGPV